MSGVYFGLQKKHSGDLLEVGEFSSWLYGALLHRAFQYHPFIVLIWL